MKIVYVTETLAPRGGTERILTEKANYLAEQYKYNVFIISCTQQQDQPNTFPLSPSVKQIKLGIPYYSQYRYKYPKRLFIKLSLNKRLKKSVAEIVQQINPDILVGIGHYKADIICSINCHAKKIIECHEARFFTLLETGKNISIISRINTFLFRSKYFRTIEKKADAIITLTEGDRKEWEKAHFTRVIPNFSTMPISSISNCKQKRIIAVGRLEWEKGYERLIDIWEVVSIKFSDWYLDIYGEGSLYKELKAIIYNRGIKRIQIHNETNNISKEYANSSIFVSTSYFEGFPLVLLEAMKHGVPCIAFDCPFGPASIINDSECGYLIENGNKSLYARKLCHLIENESLRNEFSHKAIKRIKDFNADSIMRKWKELFESLCST